jgi:hypothetical protein
MYGKNNKPSPQHFIIVEAPDGYFSLSLTRGKQGRSQTSPL